MNSGLKDWSVASSKTRIRFSSHSRLMVSFRSALGPSCTAAYSFSKGTMSFAQTKEPTAERDLARLFVLGTVLTWTRTLQRATIKALGVLIIVVR